MNPAWSRAGFIRGFSSACFVVRNRLSQHLLHPDDVEEGSFLAADLAEAAGFDEAVLAVEGETAFVERGDAGEDRANASLPGPGFERLQGSKRVGSKRVGP